MLTQTIIIIGILSNNIYAEDTEDIQWKVTLDIIETSGKTATSFGAI